MLTLATIFSILLAAPTGCPAKTLKTVSHQQSGPTCMVAAACTAISARHTPPAQRDLARNLPIYPDGVHAYDLVVELERRGWRGLVFTGPPEAAARLVEAGFAVLAMVKDRRGRHAVTVTGRKRVAAHKGCSTALKALQINDSRTAKTRWVSAQAFKASQSEQQLVVFYRPNERQRLGAAGFPVAVAQKIDRRFRAQTLLRRANKHRKPNRQMLTLLRRAVELDPCFKRSRDAYQRVGRRLGGKIQSLPSCRQQ